MFCDEGIEAFSGLLESGLLPLVAWAWKYSSGLLMVRSPPAKRHIVDGEPAYGETQDIEVDNDEVSSLSRSEVDTDGWYRRYFGGAAVDI